MTEETIEEKSYSGWYLGIAVAIVLVVFGFFYYKSHFMKEEPKTVEEMLGMAMEGKLGDRGYVYKDIYPFVNVDDFWYTQLKSPKGTKLFQMNFRYGPREVEDVKVAGTFNETFFNENKNFFITFDPIGDDLKYIQLAVADFDSMIIKVFGKVPLAACAKNETKACANRPIITCEDRIFPVIYFRSSDDEGVFMQDNCITIQGRGLGIIKATDRFLLGILEVMTW